jgi:hypothetical protein
MLAPAVRIEAGVEADIGAVVGGDDALRMVGQIFCRRPTKGLQIIFVFLHLLQFELVVGDLETVARIEPSTSAFWRGCR